MDSKPPADRQAEFVDVQLLDVLAQVEAVLRHGREIQREALRVRGVPQPVNADQRRAAGTALRQRVDQMDKDTQNVVRRRWGPLYGGAAARTLMAQACKHNQSLRMKCVSPRCCRTTISRRTNSHDELDSQIQRAYFRFIVCGDWSPPLHDDPRSRGAASSGLLHEHRDEAPVIRDGWL